MPDIPAAGRGRHALFSWQTILALRILNDLHGQFAVEIVAWRDAMAQCQQLLHGKAFPSLWGMTIIFLDKRTVTMATKWDDRGSVPALVVPLDPHLRTLASHSSAPSELQLPLFAALVVQR